MKARTWIGAKVGNGVLLNNTVAVAVSEGIGASVVVGEKGFT